MLSRSCERRWLTTMTTSRPRSGTIRLGRVTCGIVAGAVGILCMFVLNALEAHFLGHATRGSLWLGLMGGGSAVLWLADRLGILASAYSEPTLGLGQHR